MKVIVVLADIHFGKSKEPEEFFNEMKISVLDKLNELPILDAIIIAGDFFDRVLTMQSLAATTAVKFIIDLYKIAIEKKSKVRIIQGTKSHDNNMISWFDTIAKNNSLEELDIRTFYTVSTERLFNDMNILYIPEEYIKDFNEHYDKYFIKDEYDMVIGHGLIDKASFVAKIQESENTSLSAPVFKSEDLHNICKGPILFGHIHTHMKIDDRAYYVSSTSRFSFGEEKPKGFLIIYYNDDKSYKIDFVENNLAPIYKTLKFDIKEKIQDNTLFVKFIRSELNNSIYRDTNKYRLIFNSPDESYIPSGLKIQLQSVFNSKNIKILFNVTLKSKEQIEEERQKEKEFLEMQFIYDDNISMEAKIYKYITKKNLGNISEDRIREILYTKYLN